MSEDAFNIFWQAYPRKTGKLAAQRKWVQFKPDLKEVLRALEWQRRSKNWTKDNGQFIPHPATYIHQGRWMDEPDDHIASAPVMGIAPSKTGRAMVY